MSPFVAPEEISAIENTKQENLENQLSDLENRLNEISEEQQKQKQVLENLKSRMNYLEKLTGEIKEKIKHYAL